MTFILALVRRLVTAVTSLAAPSSPETEFFGIAADVPQKEAWAPQP